MEVLKISSSKAHYYSQDGEPVFEVMGKTTGRPRPTNIRDARELNLLPSYTTVIKNGLPTPIGLQNWKLDLFGQVLLTMPRKEDEALDEFINRANEEFEYERSIAPDLGSNVHSLVAKHIDNKQIKIREYTIEEAECFNLARGWIDINVIEAQTEKIIVDLKNGCAGTADFFGLLSDSRMAVIDWKTQKVKFDAKGNPKPVFYNEMLYQLAAMKQVLSADVYMNILIPTTPGIKTLFVKEWTLEEIDWGWQVFKSALNTYRLVNKYSYREIK